MAAEGVDVRDRMRGDWDARAAENAFHYVASGRESWTIEEFRASGRESVQTIVLDDLERISGGRDPRQMCALEIGCGAGRMTSALADVFGEVHGIDVSPVMIERAREVVGDRENAHLHVCDGASIPECGGRRFDFILSYIVFQHIPDKQVVDGYIREAAGRLQEGGVFKFQVQGAETESGNAPDTWEGAYYGPDDVARAARDTKCEVLDFEGLGEQYFWVWFRKTGEETGRDRAVEMLLADAARLRQLQQTAKKKLAERTAWAQSLDARIAELDVVVPRLQAEVEERTAWARRLEEESTGLHDELEKRTGWARERDAHAAELTTELQRLQGEFDERTQWAKSLDAELESRTQWARSLEKELTELRAWADTARRSLPYRVAAKLRLLPPEG